MKKIIYNHTIEHLKTKMSKKSKHFLQLCTEVGVSNWLTMLPTAEYGLEIRKKRFWGIISSRHFWEISNLPSTCLHGSIVFVTIKHNLKDLTSKILPEICIDTEIEPKFIQLSGQD